MGKISTNLVTLTITLITVTTGIVFIFLHRATTPKQWPLTWDRRYDFKIIFAEKFGKKMTF
jgi:hypothetical protein